jgi:magnesium-transporting ATPase (P-type)
MKRKPVSLSVGIFDNVSDLIFNSLMIGILSFTVAFIYWKIGSDKWQTILFTMLAFTHIFQALTIRTKDYFYKSSNVVMLYIFGFIFVSQILITQIEELRVIFNVVRLDVSDFIICFILSTLMLVFEFNKGEKVKYIYFKSIYG